MAKVDEMHTQPRAFFESSTAYADRRRRASDLKNCYQVLHSFIKSVDEDGIECLHEIISHPSISGGKEQLVGVSRVLDYYHEGSCFVDFRREYKCRSNWESRGAAELATTTQTELKAIRDSRLNRNDLATNPAIRSAHRANNGPGTGRRLGIAPGHLVIDDSSGRGGETKYMEPPRFDEATLEMEAALNRDNANLLGLHHEGLPQGKLMMHQQFIVTSFLIPCREVMIRVLALDQQFMDPIYVSRVIGGGSQGFTVSREEIAGQFDVQLEFDVKMLDIDYIKARWTLLKEMYGTDRSGIIKDEVITRWVLSTIDPALADTALGDAKEVAEDEYNEEMEQLAIATMNVVIPPKNVRNPESRLRAITEGIQTNPKLGAVFQQDAAFQQIVQARAAKYQQDIDQRKNAGIGRTGWQEPSVNQPAPEEQLLNTEP